MPATISAITMPAVRLRFFAVWALSFFCRSGLKRQSTKLTNGLRRNAITTPEMSGDKIFPIDARTVKKPGRFVKMTTSRMLMKITTSAVRPHLKYRLFESRSMRPPPTILIKISHHRKYVK